MKKNIPTKKAFKWYHITVEGTYISFYIHALFIEHALNILSEFKQWKIVLPNYELLAVVEDLPYNLLDNHVKIYPNLYHYTIP